MRISRTDRGLATVFGLVAFSIAVGGKSAAVGLFLLGGVALFHRRMTCPTGPLFEFERDWGLPLALLAAFSCFGEISSLWAIKPSVAFGPPLILLANVAGTVLLLMMVRQMPLNTLPMAGSWFVIGMTAGMVVLAEELFSDYAVTRFLLSQVPGLVLNPQSVMMEWQKGTLVRFAIDQGNWSVAAVNVLFWPAMLFVTKAWHGRRRIAGLGLLVVLLVLVTFVSAHETSKAALIFSVCAFLVALRYGDFARKAVVVGLVSIFVAVVPLSYAGFNYLNLHKASWVQESLKARFIIWGVTSEHMMDSPVLGIGARNTEAWRQKWLPDEQIEPGFSHARSTANHAHNIYLQTWFELGLIGVLLLGAACAVLLSRMSKLDPRSLPYAVGASVSAIAIAGASWSLWHSWLTALFGISLCLIVLGDRNLRSRQ